MSEIELEIREFISKNINLRTFSARSLHQSNNVIVSALAQLIILVNGWPEKKK